MTHQQIFIATLFWFLLTTVTYILSNPRKIFDCYKMWFTRDYWTNYNIVEFASWLAKATIIIPGLIFNVQIWWLYFFTLFTSLTLIWASNKKFLPTLVGFNTIWAWISCMVLAQNLI